MKAAFSVLILIFCVLVSVAQQTGDFTRVIITQDPQLSGDSLHIYFHIPAEFDFQQPAKLIIGQHGLGDPENSTQIRQYLTGVSDTLDAILMCPDPYLQDQPKSRAALNEAIDSVLTWYSINEDEMYIAGYSAGSDVAAQYVFENPEHPMKGLIWHSPGFFSNPDMNNQASFPPVCLCYGTSDFVSLLQANTLENTFSNSTVPFLYNEIQGVGHTMNYPAVTTEVLECITFIDANSTLGFAENATSKLHIFPNPVSGNDVLTISGLSQNALIEVMDVTGKKLATYTPQQGADKLQIQNFSQQLEKGIYLLQLSADNTIAFHKVIVQ